jgi:hypothetical protein
LVFCRLLTQGVGIGLQEQVVEILRGLLDSESLTVDAEKSEFLETFYSLYMKQLCGIIDAGGERCNFIPLSQSIHPRIPYHLRTVVV